VFQGIGGSGVGNANHQTLACDPSDPSGQIIAFGMYGNLSSGYTEGLGIWDLGDGTTKTLIDKVFWFSTGAARLRYSALTREWLVAGKLRPQTGAVSPMVAASLKA
jgi:hypothetical protein